MSLFFMEYTLLHGNTKLQALIHKLAEWFQSQNVQLEILYGPFFFSHCQGSTFQKLCQGPNTFHIYYLCLPTSSISSLPTSTNERSFFNSCLLLGASAPPSLPLLPTPRFYAMQTKCGYRYYFWQHWEDTYCYA